MVINSHRALSMIRSSISSRPRAENGAQGQLYANDIQEYSLILDLSTADPQISLGCRGTGSSSGPVRDIDVILSLTPIFGKD